MINFKEKFVSRISALGEIALSKKEQFLQLEAPTEMQLSRLELCKACAFQDNMKCTRCGCFVEILISISPVKCPLNRWGAC